MIENYVKSNSIHPSYRQPSLLCLWWCWHKWPAVPPSQKSTAHVIIYSTQYLIMIINSYGSGLCICNTVFFIIILEYTLSVCIKICCKRVCHHTLAASSYISCLLSLDCAIFSCTWFILIALHSNVVCRLVV